MRVGIAYYEDKNQSDIIEQAFTERCVVTWESTIMADASSFLGLGAPPPDSVQ
jgi:hypothetical protein